MADNNELKTAIHRRFSIFLFYTIHKINNVSQNENNVFQNTNNITYNFILKRPTPMVGVTFKKGRGMLKISKGDIL